MVWDLASCPSPTGVFCILPSFCPLETPSWMNMQGAQVYNCHLRILLALLASDGDPGEGLRSIPAEAPHWASGLLRTPLQLRFGRHKSAQPPLCQCGWSREC